MNESGKLQSVIDPVGPQARHINDLLWFFGWVSLAIYVLVLLFLVLALVRRRTSAELPNDPSRNRRMGIVVGSATGLTIIVLFILLISDFLTGREVHALADQTADLTIAITGHQWWWEAVYKDPLPSNTVTTANEVHLPVGATVVFELNSGDVVHSFWIPNLHGKKDLIPGYPTEIRMRADHEGTYFGQCAEFCGHQHAHMRFLVIVENKKSFDAWISNQRKPAIPPSNDLQKRGQTVFLGTTCIMCHTITGTSAGARVGPNLTHIASRQMIAAGTRPNTIDNLSTWILNPHQFKRGVLMPQNNLRPDELRPLAEYLESLK